jgi:hypothetical protein
MSNTTIEAAVATALLAVAEAACAQSPAPTAIAIVQFDYLDTSGEPRDQGAEHQRRLLGFMQALSEELTRSGKYRLVSPSCRAMPCSIATAAPAELIEASRKAGARLLLYGGIHKLSTLVQWGKMEMVDVQSGKLVYDRLVTFRGDDDEAWRRAEDFLAKDLEAQTLPH